MTNPLPVDTTAAQGASTATAAPHWAVVDLSVLDALAAKWSEQADWYDETASVAKDKHVRRISEVKAPAFRLHGQELRQAINNATAPIAPTDASALLIEEHEDEAASLTVGCDVSWGCRVSYGPTPDGKELRLLVNVSDDAQRDGIAARALTPAQLRTQAAHLLAVAAAHEARRG